MEPFQFSFTERKILESIPSPLVVYHMNTIEKESMVVLVSDGAYKFFNISRTSQNDFLKNNIQASIFNNDLNKINSYNKNLLEKPEEKYKILFRFKFHNSDIFSWVIAEGNYKKIDESNYLYYITLSTINEPNNEVRIIKKSEIDKEKLNNGLDKLSINDINNLQKVMAKAKFFYWIYDVQSKGLLAGNYSPELFKSNEVIHNYPEFLFKQKIIHIDDQKKYYKMFNEVLMGAKNTEATLQIYDLTKKTYVLSNIRFTAIFDKNGKTIKIIGTSESLATCDEMYKRTQKIFGENGLVTWTYDINSQKYNFSKPNIESVTLLNNFDLIKDSINNHRLIIPDEMKECKKNSSYQMLEIRDNYGRVRKFEITFSFINDKIHQPIYILGIARDVTSYYEKEALYIKKLEKANINKSTFLSHLSHDMRTPLGAISSISEFGLEDVKDPIALNYFAKIHDNSKYLLSFISDVIEARKIDSSLFQIHQQIYKLYQVFFEIISVITPRAEEKNIKLYTQIPPEIKELFVYCDVGKIKQVIINILNNAIKYTPSNGIVEFIIKTKLINNKISLIAIIRDNGVGMSKQFQKHMFEEYSQEENRLSFEEEGTGLGLSIVKKTLVAMNGFIHCDSELEKGTTFKISLDIPIATQGQIDFHNKTISKSNYNLLSGKRMLICEDKPINLMIVKKLLSDRGIVVDVAENGKIGVDKVRKNQYDIILMDIRMPILDGLTASKIIRRFNKITPIIALSANAYAEDIQKSLDAGINAHIPKPINKEELYETIIKYIST